MKAHLNSITDVPGIRVGHDQDEQALTGCTVILCEEGTTGGVSQAGGAPGTRETDALTPMHLVDRVDAVVLAGGSAFGLDAASGVMQYLSERGVGFNAGVAKVPIVPAAILFDLAIGLSNIRPDAAMGYRACQNASSEPSLSGNIGAGTGATIGKILGMNHAMKSGIGSTSIDIGNGVIIGAIMAVNAFGDVINPSDQKIIAGARTLRTGPFRIGEEGIFANTMDVMRRWAGRITLGFSTSQNTIIGTVATNAKFNKEQANKIAQMAQDGIAQVIRPAHTMLDGDTIFALATNRRKADVNIVGAFAAQVVATAIILAIKHAKSVAGLPAASDFRSDL